MSRQARHLVWLRRHAAVRLRREAWGGFAFHRDTGDLLELDREGFEIAMLLGTAHTIAGLYSLARTKMPQARPQFLAGFLRGLEVRGIIERIALDAPSLHPDPWADDRDIENDDALRAPIVAH